MRQIAQFSLAVLLAASQLGPAATTVHAQQTDNRVSLNFVDTDIPAVLRALSLFTQRNFLVDPRVKGKLTLVSDRPVDSAQALSMLTGALRLQGFAIVDVDGVTRVVPEADAKLQGSAVVGNGRPAQAVGGAPAGGAGRGPVPVAAFAKGSSGEMLTRVFPLKYENAANLVPVLRPMVPPNNPINAYPGNNTLVVTDYADNLERIAQVIARIDVPSSIDTDVVPVRSAIATDIAILASQLLDTQSSDPTQRIAVVADPRSNSVLVRSGSPARTRLARDLIMKLDAQQNRAGNLHVVYMRNAQATRIAEVLGGLLTGQANSAPGATGGAAAGAVPRAAHAHRTHRRAWPARQCRACPACPRRPRADCRASRSASPAKTTVRKLCRTRLAGPPSRRIPRPIHSSSRRLNRFTAACARSSTSSISAARRYWWRA